MRVRDSVPDPETRVKRLADPLELLVQALPTHRRPRPLRPYTVQGEAVPEFDNEEGPPWEGEWNNKEQGD